SWDRDGQLASAKGNAMIKNFEDVQKFGQVNVDTALKFFGDWNKGWQAIAAEITDYSKRAFEDGTATFEKLAAAKSVEQAFEIQTSYVKRSYDEYMHQLSKIGNMYAEITKEAYRPLERVMPTRR
ncbi:MAG TPA: phasin family protein, partial [Hyphomicrobiaceae bacterium]|nr:phasin family protein [Hyphomicrobiaceae bacterium]